VNGIAAFGSAWDHCGAVLGHSSFSVVLRLLMSGLASSGADEEDLWYLARTGRSRASSSEMSQR
jgi:hypothetical protein